MRAAKTLFGLARPLLGECSGLSQRVLAMFDQREHCLERRIGPAVNMLGGHGQIEDQIPAGIDNANGRRSVAADKGGKLHAIPASLIVSDRDRVR